MTTIDISIANSLEKLGLTQNEAKIFLYLAEKPNSNGYEISKNTGISRSLVYGSLEKMTSTGILELTQTNSSSYKLKSIEEIKDIVERGINNAFNVLTEKLSEIKPDTADELFITIQDRDNQKAKMRYLIKTANEALFISAGMRELDWIKDELYTVHESVKVHIFSLAKIDGMPGRFNIYSKEMDDSFIQSMKSLKNKWRILIIKDASEMILCGGDDIKNGVGIYTKNPMTVTFAREHFIHDVKIYNIERKYTIEDNTENLFS